MTFFSCGFLKNILRVVNPVRRMTADELKLLREHFQGYILCLVLNISRTETTAHFLGCSVFATTA